jgi:hypothetical protein
MERGRRISWTWLATLALALSPALGTRGLASMGPAVELGVQAARLAARPPTGIAQPTDAGRATHQLDDDRHDTGPPPVTHRPGRPGGGVVEGPRDQRQGRRRLPDSRATDDPSARGPRLGGHVSRRVRERYAATLAALFHDANAPPACRLLADRHS